MITDRVRQLIVSGKTLEEKAFWGVLFFAVFATGASTIVNLYLGLGGHSGIMSVGALLMFVAVGVIAKKTGRVSICYFIACILLNVFILPPIFFWTGGFESGIIFNCFMGIFLCSLYNHKKRRFVLVLIAICSYEMTFFLARQHPELINMIDPELAHLDYSVSFFLMAVALYAGVAFLVYVFDHERRQRDALIKKLDFYSKRDPLTRLFNRNHFINYLEKMIWPERSGFYMMKYGVDEFRDIVDKYGNDFGDKVLCGIANVAASTRIVGFGECAARFGDTDFIQLFYAKSSGEAFQRAEQLRKDISELEFEDHPEVRVTVSGGFVDCSNEGFYHQNKMLRVLDLLLELAKSRGRNQICIRE